MRQIIQQAVRILRSNPQASDGEVLELVMASGIEYPMAVQLVTLLPLAYGRLMLSDTVGAFPDAYICVGEDGQPPRKGSLTALRVWHEAIQFARQDQEEFLPIAGRSCEVQVVVTALNDGSKPQDLVFGPPVFNWPIDAAVKSSGLASTRQSWLRQVWNSPAEHSVTPGELIIARVVMIVALLIGLLAVGVLAYFAFTL